MALEVKNLPANAGSIPGSGRSPAERIGYPLQCSCPSLMSQMVKKPPVMKETWVQFLVGIQFPLGWEDLEESKETHSSVLAWRIPGNRSPAGHSSWSPKESDMTEQLSIAQHRGNKYPYPEKNLDLTASFWLLMN